MGNFIEKDITEVFNDTFLDYAGYNIQRRAIPDARDGLKWGARQILYSQDLGGFTYNKPFKKATKSVSQAMGFCYVHGDAPAYGTLIRMAKPFSYRYCLQEANGNFGTLINPNDHSASRYVELRGSELASILLEDIKKNTITEWEDTYDLEGQFPKVLPSKGFWGGVNGCISIGSGMSCSIPPTNLREVNETMIKMIDNPDISDDECICMPDFPTGATIINSAETRESLKNGHGFACKIRASIDWDDKERCFIVKEMPYSTFTNTICSELAELLESDPDCGISDFKDFTGTKPDLRIYLSKKANPDKVLRRIYKETSLETFFSINIVMLDNGTTPRVFTWREALQAHINHERVVYRRGFEFDLAKIAARINIIEGLLICLANVEEVVRVIKESVSTTEAAAELKKKFLLNDEQVKAILDMKLSRLAHLEVEKLKNELASLEKERDRITTILSNSSLLDNEVKNGLKKVAEKFGDNRRTNIINLSSDGSDEPIELISLQVSLTNKNHIITNQVSSLYARRGSVGSKVKLDPGEYVVSTKVMDSNTEVLFFTNDGIYYHCNSRTFEIDNKIALDAIMPIKNGEHICEFVAIDKNSKPYIMFITNHGFIKKSKIEEYNVNRAVGAKAIALNDGDFITSVIFAGEDKVGVMTNNGNFIIFDSSSINPIGRVAKGVKAITLNKDDYVMSARVIPKETSNIVSVSGNGLIKATPITEFAVQGRGTKGAKIQNIEDVDWAADFYPITSETTLTIAATHSNIRLNIVDIPVHSRMTSGVKSIKLAPRDNVIKIC